MKDAGAPAARGRRRGAEEARRLGGSSVLSLAGAATKAEKQPIGVLP